MFDTLRNGLENLGKSRPKNMRKKWDSGQISQFIRFQIELLVSFLLHELHTHTHTPDDECIEESSRP